ncbi:MAG TPA: aminotransferase class I/II-fold pyridoxal phosphate-dependent enzyme [Gaiellales bacterium]|nr:aminotransferase class I/II-fold pyridoxal phosphate-dependent enzyme [Gaiellales bacterium]
MTDSPRRDAATAAIHAGRLPVLPGVPVIPPVHRSVIYEFVDAGEFADVMDDASRGYLYTRIRNPSTDELGAVVAELEGAEAGLCFASGMGALSAAVAELAPPGAGMVAATQIYGQTHHMAATRPDGRLVDIGDMRALRRAAEGAALVVCETVSNPSLAVAEVAHAAGARLVVDNTIATPIGCRPLDHGADLVFHSATKYLNGHSDVLAGVAAGSAELIGRLAERSLELGATLAPDSAWLVRRGIRTLHLRVERAAENAMAIATFLDGHPRVRRVMYPGLASHPSHDVARRILRSFGGLMSFEVEGGRPGGEAVMDRVELCVRATSLGGVETCVSHPASTSHRQLSAAELADAGIAEGDLRLTVGCEHVDDLIADLEQALR